MDCVVEGCIRKSVSGKLCLNHYQKNLRFRIMDMIGERKCVRCGFDDIRALQLDHINGGGCKEHRSKGPISAYYFYLRNESIAKQEIQTLCANCNWIKKNEKKENRR